MDDVALVERSSSSSSKRPHQPTVDEVIADIRTLSFNDRLKVIRKAGCSPESQRDELVRLATLQLHGSRCSPGREGQEGAGKYSKAQEDSSLYLYLGT